MLSFSSMDQNETYCMFYLPLYAFLATVASTVQDPVETRPIQVHRTKLYLKLHKTGFVPL